jgi:lysophospholipase L1-like esterase
VQEVFSLKWYVRILVILFALFCGVKAVPVEKVSSGDSTSTTVRYVALGDSIAYGYGLEDREEQSYTGRIARYLESRYDCVLFNNFGTNGMTSDDLLDVLSNPENENYKKYRSTISYADIVTLSIGSNDLLQFLKVDRNMDTMIENGEEIFDAACENFKKNFPQIIREIRKINPDVMIYADNIYNPAKGLSAFQNVYDIAEYYIKKINSSYYESDDYCLVDVKAVFDGAEESMINVFWKGRQIDPHPSVAGHKKIADAVIKEMAKS